MHDALEAQAALARVGLELELDQWIDIEPIAALARAEQEIDGVHRIAWAEHAFAGGQRPELEARPAELFERGISRPAHQGRARDKVGQGFARACGACGGCVHCGCGSPRNASSMLFQFFLSGESLPSESSRSTIFSASSTLARFVSPSVPRASL